MLMKRTIPPLDGISVNEAQAKIAAYDTLVSRWKTGLLFGKQYQGQRDIAMALGYPRDITWEDCVALYRRQDIAKAVIDRPVQATWRGDFRLFEEKDEETTSLESEWKKIYADMQLKTMFIRLDKLACLGRYAGLFLGFDDVFSIEGYKNPVRMPKNGGVRKLLYVKPLGENVMDIFKLDEDPTSSRYGLPLLYQITLGSSETTHNAMMMSTTRTCLIHYSRILHVTGPTLESEYEGEPELECIYNRLLDLQKLIGGSAEMFWRGARPGYQGIVDPQATLTSNSEKQIAQQFDEYDNNLRRFLFMDGVTVKSLDSQVSSPKDHVEVQIQMISAVKGIPKRILTGSEQGELASVQDRDNWNDTIQTRREEYAESQIVRPFINRCIMYGVLPQAINSSENVGNTSGRGDYSIQWPDVYAPSPTAKASIGKTRAASLKEYLASPLAMDILPIEAFLTFCMGLSEEDVTYIMKLREENNSDEELLAQLMAIQPGSAGSSEQGHESGTNPEKKTVEQKITDPTHSGEIVPASGEA